MSVSVALHAAFILLVAWRQDDAPAPVSRADLVVSLDSRDATGDDPLPSPDVASEAADPPKKTETREPAANEPLTASTKPATAEPLSQPQPQAKPPQPAPLAETRAVAQAATASTDPSPRSAAPAAGSSTATIAAVTTAATTTTVVQPFDRRQRKMLDKKLSDWSESYAKAVEAGGEVSWQQDGQRYTARFSELPADSDMALDRVLVEVSTEIEGERLKTQMRMKRLAFSHYAQFVNRWDKDVQIHDDELDGRFHANSAINLTYSRDAKPQFHGKVTTAARRININADRGRARRDEMFLGGLQTGVRSIRLPKNFVPLPQTADIRDDQLQEFDEDTRITFHADGSYTWVAYKDGLFERRGHLRAPASYLIATNKAKLYVRGTVKGKVLVYSPERIVIAGDLVYAGDPAKRSTSEDYLGLVSARTIEVAGPKTTGPGDVHINAAIYAKRRFAVTRYRARNGGTLEIFGSLTAGTISATEPRFATKILFDPRLEGARPPGFPVTDRYEVESWDAAWTVDASSASKDAI